MKYLITLIFFLLFTNEIFGQYLLKLKGETFVAPFDSTIVVDKKFLKLQLTGAKNNQNLLYTVKKQWQDYQIDLSVKDSLYSKKFNICQQRVDSLVAENQQLMENSDSLLSKNDRLLSYLDANVRKTAKIMIAQEKNRKKDIILFTIGGVCVGGVIGFLIGFFN